MTFYPTNPNDYDVEHNPSNNTYTFTDKRLTIIEGTVGGLTHDNQDRYDKLKSWVRGFIRPTQVITEDNQYEAYAAKKGYAFTFKARRKLKPDTPYIFIGHLSVYQFQNGSYSYTLESNTVVDTLTFQSIEQVLLSKQIKKNQIENILSIYKDMGADALRAYLDLRRGTKSYFLADFKPDLLNKITKALDTDGEKSFGRQLVISELTPYLGSSNKFPETLFERYGFDAFDRLKEDPWSLKFYIPRYTLTTGDNVAQKLGMSQEEIEQDDRRTNAIVKSALLDFINDRGYTYIPHNQLQELYDYYIKLHLTYDEFVERLKSGVYTKIEETTLGYHPSELLKAEQQIYQAMDFYGEEINAMVRPAHMALITEEMADQHKNADFKLTELQEKAVHESVKSQLFILTGGPGTGKTTTLSAIIRAHQLVFDYGVNTLLQTPVLLAAPTGKAAERMTKQTGITASTVHKTFGIIPGEGLRDASWSADQLISAGVKLVVIDEASMLDTITAGAIFEVFAHMTEPPKLILQGDINQLPSVGPGQILKDLIDFTPHHIHLTEVKRQANGSPIPELANLIQQGKFPDQQWFKKHDNISFKELSDSADIANFVKRLTKHYKKTNNIPNDIPAYDHFYGEEKIDQLQILTPYVNVSKQHKDLFDSANEINGYLQSIFNPKSKRKREITESTKRGRIFREGDRVICSLNMQDKGVSNGSVGIITKIGTHGSEDIKDWTINVDFNNGSNIIEFEIEDWKHLSLAYALSIHKSQGSEYETVVIPLVREAYTGGFLSRNLIYTAITRASKNLALVGHMANFHAAVKNSLPPRLTTLQEFFKGTPIFKENA